MPVKFMLWDSLNGMKPLSDTIDVKVRARTTLLGDGEKYAWVMENPVLIKENEEDTTGKVQIRLYTQDGEAKMFELADSVDLWSKADDVPRSSIAKESVVEEFKTADFFLKLDEEEDGTPIKLVKYCLDGEGKINRLYCATKSAATSSTKRPLVVDPYNMHGITPTDKTLNGHSLLMNSIKFDVPIKQDSMANEKNYAVGNIDEELYSEYITESGSEHDFILAEFNAGFASTVVINFIQPEDYISDFDIMTSEGFGPNILIADKAVPVYDEYENMSYTINGHINNEEVSFATNIHTQIGVIGDGDIYDGNKFNVDRQNPIWKPSDISYLNKDLNDEIKPGDMVLYTGDEKNNAAVKYISVDKLKEYVNDQNENPYNLVTHEANPATHYAPNFVSYYFSKLSDIQADITDESMLMLTLEDLETKIPIDSSKRKIDVVEIDKEGKTQYLKGGTKTGDFKIFDEESKQGDFVFVSMTGSTINNIVIYRFVEELTPVKPVETVAPTQPLNKLSGGEKYGWIMKMPSVPEKDNEAEELKVTLYTQDGEAEELAFAGLVHTWLYGDENDAHWYDVGDLKEKEAYDFMTVDGTPIRLVKYKLNEDGKISRFYTAVADDLGDREALVIDPKNLRGEPSRRGAVNNYFINDGIKEFTVPSDAAYMDFFDNYNIGEVTSGDYVTVNGSDRNYVIGEFVNSDMYATVVINIVRAKNAIASFDDMSRLGAGPEIMIADSVKKVEKAEDDDSPETQYIIKGYLGNMQISYTTSKLANFGEIDGEAWTGTGYGVTEKWNARSETDENSLAGCIKKGDLLLYTVDNDGNISLIAKYVSVDAVLDSVQNGTGSVFGSHEGISSAYAGYYMNKLASRNNTSVTLDGVKLPFDMGNRTVDMVEINRKLANPDIPDDKETVTVSIVDSGVSTEELVPYDNETKLGDVVFISTASDAINTVIVYRLTETPADTPTETE